MTSDAGRLDSSRPGASRAGANHVDPCSLSGAALDALVHDLQKRAFEIYEDAALHAETDPAIASVTYARAEQEAAPLIERARAANDERVRRLRRRAHAWRRAALAVAVIGIGVLAWWWLARG